MQLRHISIPLLVAAAGGDPWAINKSLQVGRPIQISDLAEAFHAAGRCTTEASAAFDEARRRFEASWNRENGEHPINDSAEVQRVVQSLGAQSLQLPPSRGTRAGGARQPAGGCGRPRAPARVQPR
jgi:hypothetical protein